MRFRLPVLAAALTVLLAVVPGAQAAEDPIQPGDRHWSELGGCTLNFVYDGVGDLAGKVYLGTAAHCVGRVGEPQELESGEVFGNVAFIGDAALGARDYAFIQVDEAFEGIVVPAVKGHPQYPRGVVTAGEAAIGDPVQLSGYGVPFFATTPTQEQRRAVLTGMDGEQHRVAGPLLWGDSGGPLVHVPSGEALGIVSRLCKTGCTERGPLVSVLIADAAAHGFTVKLRTV